MNSFKLCVFVFELLCLIITTQEQYAPLVLNSKFLEPYINLQPFSTYENDKAPAYVSSYYEEDESPLYFFCPLQTNTEGENVLIYRQQYENNIFLDEPTPVTCELPIRGVFEKLRSFPENTEYKMGLHVYKKVIESENEIITANSQNSYKIPIFNFTFNEKLKMIISASYQINAPPFMNISSNNKTIIPYDKNLELLISPVDERYKYFETEVLPRMLKEIDDSLLGEFCHNNNITPEQCIAENESIKFAEFKEMRPTKRMQRIACDLGIQKVQLVPKDDFITDAKKTATYADILTIPIWKAFLFKWNAVEIFLRKLAKITGNLKVETGVSGTLEKVEKHYKEDLDLNKQLHVPKYIWKIVYITKYSCSQEAILIVLFNNPFELSGCVSSFASSWLDGTRRGWPIESEESHTGKICCFEVNEKIKKELNIVTELRKCDIFDLFSNYSEKHKLPYDVSNPQERIYDW